MNLLVLSAHAISDTHTVIGDWRFAESLGHTVSFSLSELKAVPDAIVGMSISRMRQTQAARCEYPKVPLFLYNWDCYEWIWSTPRPGEYNYQEYGNLLKKASEVWVPSHCTGLRTREWWQIENWHVILSSVPYWDYDHVESGDYALCSLREIPDLRWDWFEKACKELDIPYRMSQHKLNFAEYQKTVANCRFLCSPLYELSTGGLTLLEGYYLGKPCLLSDSPYHGGSDYFGSRAYYFDHHNFEDFKRKLRQMYYETPTVAPDAREWMVQNYHDSRMVKDMLNRIEAVV